MGSTVPQKATYDKLPHKLSEPQFSLVENEYRNKSTSRGRVEKYMTSLTATPSGAICGPLITSGLGSCAQ